MAVKVSGLSTARFCGLGFLSEEVDDCVLLMANPAGQGGDEDLRWVQDDGHPVIVATC